MKLSEAIQLGAMLQPQIYGPFSTCDGTCAMGAALEAVGQLFKMTETNARRIKKIWPWLRWRLALDYCPWCGREERFLNVYDLIVHLNDDDHLTRQTIASLILGVEAQASRQIELLDPALKGEQLAQLEANLPRRRRSIRRAQDRMVNV